MARIRDLPGAAWFAIGLGAAALIVPAAAVAAGNVGIIGSNGNTAKVTASGSLQAAEATPASFKEYVRFGITDPAGCVKIATAPAHKGFVAKELTVDVWDDPSPGSGQDIEFFTTKTCSVRSIIFDVNPGSVGAYGYDFEAGFGIAPGHSLYAEAFGVSGETYLNGFYVNPKAIHVNTPHAVTGKAVAQK